MIKKISLRWRLTLLTSILIAVFCIGLSILLNISAYRMADSIDAVMVQPAQSVVGAVTEEMMMPLVPADNLETVNQAKHMYLMESLLYTMIAVVAGGIITYYISGKALEPVRELNEQIKNINTHNLNESLEIPPTGDELAELTESFNDMTNKLAQVFAMQKRFSADAAHELRTPLAVLQTKLDVFDKKKQHSLDEYEVLTDAIKKQVKRLRELVTELLDIANMEHELQREDISLQRLLGDICNELSIVAEKKNISIATECGDIHISGDYGLLYRAFYNVIENAVKYNISDGRVRIEVTQEGEGKVTVSVRDTGIGIPDEQKKQVFEPFYRVDKSRSRKMGGAGLGLSMVETIIKKHQGMITVSDNDKGGSCFVIVLPKKKE